MRHKRQKSDKQIEASKLYLQVIRFDTTKITRTYKVEYSHGTYDREYCVTLCNVNGIKYVLFRDVPYFTGRNFVNNMKDNGKLTDSDFFHANCENKVKVFVKVEPLLVLKAEMYDYARQRSYYNKEEYDCFFSILEDDSIAIADNIFTTKELEASEKAYSRRNQLVFEAADEARQAEYKRNEEEREDKKKEREIERLRLLEETKPSGEELKDLVAKIEAMGWEVTLRIKEDKTFTSGLNEIPKIKE